MAKSKGWREGENPVTAIKDAGVLPKVKAMVKHHKAMAWQDVPAFYAGLQTRSAMAAKALMFTCLTGSRTGEVLGAKWDEIDLDAALWTVPAERMKTGEAHRVPLTGAMLAIIGPLRAMQSEYVFEGQKRHQPLSNMAMLMLLRRMKVEGATVHGRGSAIHHPRRAYAGLGAPARPDTAGNRPPAGQGAGVCRWQNRINRTSGARGALSNCLNGCWPARHGKT